jgi:HEPN domain-containing protein
MKSLRIHAFLALFGVFALAACGESGSELLLDELTLEEEAELAVLMDDGAYEVGLELTEVAGDAAMALGAPRAMEGRGLNAQARVRLAEARAAMLNGERRRALDAARDARRLMARALAALGGGEALEALIERIEALAQTADDDVFEDAAALRAELAAIAAEARALLAQGDSLGAAARALLAEQIARHRRHPDIVPDRARLEVELAATAVALAERLIDVDDAATLCAANSDVRCHRNRWLQHAKRLLAVAERALEAGHWRRAVHLAEHAHWSALKAVILPGGIQEEELKEIADLAQELYAQADAAIGDDASDLEKRLLNRAADLIEAGLARLEEGHKRGVAPLWRAAVICSWLIS